MGILAYHNRGSRSYIAFKKNISASNLPSNYPLITVDQKDFYMFIKSNEKEILNELLDGKSTVNSTLSSPIKKISSNCLSLEKYDRRKSSKNVNIKQELSIIKTLKSKFDAKKSTVNKNKEDSQKTLETNQNKNKSFNIAKSQFKEIEELKKYFEKMAEKSHEKLSYPALCHAFGEAFVEECKQRKIIIPHPKGGYVLGG